MFHQVGLIADADKWDGHKLMVVPKSLLHKTLLPRRYEYFKLNGRGEKQLLYMDYRA